MDSILKQLIEIKKELDNPFPYRDTDKIQEDFRTEFFNLSDDEDCLTGDFNTYCMNIAGTLSYVLAGKTNNIPQGQIEMLQKSLISLNNISFLKTKLKPITNSSRSIKTLNKQEDCYYICCLNKHFLLNYHENKLL